MTKQNEKIKTNTTATAPRKRKARRVASGPRVFDPAIIELRAEHAIKVAKQIAKRASAKILATIVTKRLVQLTDEDRGRLFDTLSPRVTPPLPLVAGVSPDDLKALMG